MPHPYHATAAGSYLALLALQPAWHWWLPSPYGAGLWWLGILAAIPLLLPLRGVLRGSLRSMSWAGYLLMLYFSIGVMEAWSNPPQRLPALLQVTLVIIFLAAILGFSRKAP
jgi:uncharacterized membrane protein